MDVNFGVTSLGTQRRFVMTAYVT